MKAPQLIGLSGLVGSGKSTVAQAIVDMHGSAAVVSFATPLKVMVRALLRYANLTTNEVDTFMTHKQLQIDAVHGRTMRHILQTLGTEWGRHQIHPDLWTSIGIAAARGTEAGLVVFDDVRFPNEQAAIEAAGGRCFHIERTGVVLAGKHISEGFMAGPVIANDSTPYDAAERVLSAPAAKPSCASCSKWQRGKTAARMVGARPGYHPCGRTRLTKRVEWRSPTDWCHQYERL